MADKGNRICPVERAGSLDSSFRRWLQNPRKILRPFIREGMTVLDIGCGPGFFSVELARLVGAAGRVIAADLQDGMLRRLEASVRGTELEARITLHQCQRDRIDLSQQVDFALAFYMVHELPDQQAFFREVLTILKAQGQLLVVEPPLHVSKSAFETTIKTARDAGFTVMERPRVLLSKAVLLGKG
jgi:ubiquinone/menaquinone biosynthesis C-methylase UbiE